jgi:hypothetical protein
MFYPFPALLEPLLCSYYSITLYKLSHVLNRSNSQLFTGNEQIHHDFTRHL